VRRMPGRWRSPATVTVDATGLAQSAVSTFFVRRIYHHIQQPLPWRHWLKWLAVVDVDRQLILAQSARQAPRNDCANLPSLVAEAHRQTPVGCVLADAEFDSERKHSFCRQQLKADSIFPAKRGKKSWKIHGVRAQMRADFPRATYARRSLIETSSLSPNANYPAALPAEPCLCRSARLCCSALLTTSIASGCPYT
jgi:Transposase DDE domain